MSPINCEAFLFQNLVLPVYVLYEEFEVLPVVILKEIINYT